MSGRFGTDELQNITPEKLVVDSEYDLPEQSKHFRLNSTYDQAKTSGLKK